jgi:predicted nucleic acid-binding protein
MHKNRVVTYKGKEQSLKNIKELQPTGRQKARTILVTWHGLSVYITAQKRVDKHERITIVYQVSTYKDKPINHVKTYQTRWDIEKFFRTTKQKLGLQDCCSTKKATQLNHILSVFLAYSLVHLDQKRKKLASPEDALRALNRKKVKQLESLFLAQEAIFHDVHA